MSFRERVHRAATVLSSVGITSTERHALAEARLAAVEGIIADTVASALINDYWNKADPAFTGQAVAHSVMSKLAKVTVPGL